MERIRIKAAGFEFIARFESEKAPKTCAKFRTMLPYKERIIHVRWSGEGCWIPLGELDLGLKYENHTSYPAPGEIILYPGGVSETEILLAYGGVHFASKVGQLAGNHFLTVIEGRDGRGVPLASTCCGTAPRTSCSKRFSAKQRRARGFAMVVPTQWHDLCLKSRQTWGVFDVHHRRRNASSVESRAPLYGSLFVQVVAGLVVGIILGIAAPDFAISLKILSDAFLKLIQMIVAPIVFCVVVHGIAGAGDLKKVGRVGLKALIYFEVMTTIALIVGLALAFLFAPGHGMNIDPSTLDAKALSNYADHAKNLKGAGVGSFIFNIIPTTSIDALARNDVLQVLFFAVLFGVALALVGEPAQQVTSLIEAVSKVLFKIMGLIVRVAPLGVLGAVAYTVGKYGVGSLKQLVSLVFIFYACVTLFVLVVLGAVLRFVAGLNIFKFLNYFREELTIVLATASSDAVLPQIMRKLERLGELDSVVGLVVPTGYSFNLDAFSIYNT